VPPSTPSGAGRCALAPGPRQPGPRPVAEPPDAVAGGPRGVPTLRRLPRRRLGKCSGAAGRQRRAAPAAVRHRGRCQRQAAAGAHRSETAWQPARACGRPRRGAGGARPGGGLRPSGQAGVRPVFRRPVPPATTACAAAARAAAV
ncbi:unnamed protein product, partial [Prorocentrum cordatum]